MSFLDSLDIPRGRGVVSEIPTKLVLLFEFAHVVRGTKRGRGAQAVKLFTENRRGLRDMTEYDKKKLLKYAKITATSIAVFMLAVLIVRIVV